MYVNPPECQFDYCVPNCECDPIDVEWKFELMDEYRRDPVSALRRAGGYGGQVADTELLKAIVTLAVQEDGARTAHLAQHLTRMILDGYVLPSSPKPGEYRSKRCHWELPMVGLYNLLVAIRRDGQSGPEDSDIVKQVRGDYREMVQVVMKDLTKLLPKGFHADHLRNTAVKTLAILAASDGFHVVLFSDEQTLDLIFTCWTHMSGLNRKYANALVSKLHECDGGRERAANVVGVDTLVLKFEEWLTDEQVVDEALLLELSTMYGCLLDLKSDCKQFGAAKTCDHVMTAMQRQRRLRGESPFTRAVLHWGFLVLWIFLSRPAFQPNADVEYLPPGAIELVAEAFLLDLSLRTVLPAREDVQRTRLREAGYCRLEETGYYRFINDIVHSGGGEDPTCGGRLSRTFMDECRTQAELIAWPFVMRSIDSAKRGAGTVFFTPATELWRAFEKFLGTSPGGVRTKWQEAGDCSSTKCPNRGDKGIKTKRCAGCQVARYCSTECQKSDWKMMHSDECKEGMFYFHHRRENDYSWR